MSSKGDADGSHSKYSRNHYIRETIMPQLIESEDRTQAADRRDEQRAVLRLCLHEVVSEVTAALHEADLNLQLFFSVPSSGALLTFMTPGNPGDEDWSTATRIICEIVSNTIDVRGLIGRPLTCAAAET